MTIKRTESEQLFEDFCRKHQILCNQIPVATTKTPDYELFIDGLKVVVEVKQIDSNPQEVEGLKKFLAGGVAVTGGTPGSRVRQKITSSSSQIRLRAKNKHPSLLVLYNNVLLANYTSDYNVLVAMYGLETLMFELPKGQVKPQLVSKRHGPRQGLTHKHNTSISAVGILSQVGGLVSLSIFHNHFASIPIGPTVLQGHGIKQFQAQTIPSGFQSWAEI